MARIRNCCTPYIRLFCKCPSDFEVELLLLRLSYHTALCERHADTRRWPLFPPFEPNLTTAVHCTTPAVRTQLVEVHRRCHTHPTAVPDNGQVYDMMRADSFDERPTPTLHSALLQCSAFQRRAVAVHTTDCSEENVKEIPITQQIVPSMYEVCI